MSKEEKAIMSVESIIQNVVDEVKHVEGVKAVVLGGSRARGTSMPSSDIDFGIYYDPNFPLNLNKLGNIARDLDDEHRTDLVTPIGGWGPWINGGGWLKIQSYAVDFLYRDLERVTTVIKNCLNGKVEIYYQPGHPHGFMSSIYFGEVAVCQPLWDTKDLLSELKNEVYPYPVALQQAIIQSFRWEINFSIDIAKKSVERADVTYASGCCFRSVMCMLQVLFALNKEYWLNEKGAVTIANNFSIKPAMFQRRVNESFRSLQADQKSIQSAISILMELSQDIDVLFAEIL